MGKSSDDIKPMIHHPAPQSPPEPLHACSDRWSIGTMRMPSAGLLRRAILRAAATVVLAAFFIMLRGIGFVIVGWVVLATATVLMIANPTGGSK
jgi:hypothetical protein